MPNFWVCKSFNRKTLKSAFDPELSDLTRAAAANLCIRTRNSRKPKQGSAQPRLAKPAAKRAPSRAAKGKKPLAAKTQRKRPRHVALTPKNAWHSARQACLRDRRDSGPRARFRATQTSVVDADARTASLKNALPRCETALRQRLPQTPRRELHPAHAAGVHRPRAARLPRPPCLRPGFVSSLAASCRWRQVVGASMA